MNDTPRDDRHYRRGVVLGLTMAEILLLLTFLLMLLFAAEMGREKAAFRAVEKERDTAKARVVELEPVAKAMASLGSSAFDITKEYIKTKQKLAEAEIKLGEAKDAIELAEAAKEMSAPDNNAKDAIEAYKQAAKLGAAVRAAGGSAESLASSAAICTTELKSCQGQTAYLNRRLNEQIGGFGLPPCWANAEGRVQYIFDTRMTDQGIVLADNKVLGREKDQAALPLSSARFNVALEPAAFAATMMPLRSWSEEHECRFYVRLVDDLAEGGRERYKELRRSVEGSFYILDAR